MPIKNETGSIKNLLEETIINRNIISHKYLHNVKICNEQKMESSLNNINYTYLMKWNDLLSSEGQKMWESYIDNIFYDFGHATDMGDLIGAINNMKIVRTNYNKLINATNVWKEYNKISQNKYIIRNQFGAEKNSLLLDYMNESFNMQRKLKEISKIENPKPQIYVPKKKIDFAHDWKKIMEDNGEL